MSLLYNLVDPGLFLSQKNMALAPCKKMHKFLLRRCNPKLAICFIIGPESDHCQLHWECLSLTELLTNSCLVNLIYVTLACEDDNSKLVEVLIVAYVDDEICAGNSLVQIWKVKFGLKAKFLFRL